MRILEVGETELIQGRGGWKIGLRGQSDGAQVTIFNPTDDGEGRKFYEVTTIGNSYGAPVIIQEPTLGVNAYGVNIIGALVVDEDNKIKERFSWSNVVYMQKGKFSIDSEGKLVVNGEKKGWLKLLFLADKNRIRGHVGVFVPTKPVGAPKIVEMEELILSQL